MPLTFAHPAAALPFKRLRLPISALAIGSMAPDFMKFLTMRPGNDFGHSWSGVIWFCIPAGLLALAIFHALLKRPLFSLLPESQQRKLITIPAFSFAPADQFKRVVIAIVLGASTHLLWDSFTHRNGFSIRHVPGLNGSAFPIGRHEVAIYTVLQHFSTLLGMILLLWWYVRWFRMAGERHPNDNYRFSAKGKLTIFTGLLATALIPAMAYAFLKARHHPHWTAVKIFAGRTVIVSGALFFIELIVYSIVWHIVLWSKIRDSRTPTSEFRTRQVK